jgi:hypothetical protein
MARQQALLAAEERKLEVTNKKGSLELMDLKGKID